MEVGTGMEVSGNPRLYYVTQVIAKVAIPIQAENQAKVLVTMMMN